MKNKINISRRTIDDCLLILLGICVIAIAWSSVLQRLPDEFKNLPEGEDIIDISQYEYISHEWIPSGIPNRRAKGSKTRYLYNNDPNAIFFANQPQFDDKAGTSYYHKKDDIFPKPYEETSTIILTISGKADITIEGELAIEFKKFIEECIVDSKNIIIVSSKLEYPTKADIKIYHKYYPAYHKFAYIVITSNKILMVQYMNNNYIYYKLSDNLSEQIKTLIEN